MIGATILLCGIGATTVCVVVEGIYAIFSPEPITKAITFEQWKLKVRK